MRQIAAYLLAVLGGNNNPSVEDLRKIFVAGGVDFDEERATQLVNELKGKNVYEVMKAGSSKLATFGGSGARGGSATTTTSAPVQTETTSAPVEQKKEEVKEEESASIGGLFGSDDD